MDYLNSGNIKRVDSAKNYYSTDTVKNKSVTDLSPYKKNK